MCPRQLETFVAEGETRFLCKMCGGYGGTSQSFYAHSPSCSPDHGCAGDCPEAVEEFIYCYTCDGKGYTTALEELAK